jgi:hypothetical protein
MQARLPCTRFVNVHSFPHMERSTSLMCATWRINQVNWAAKQSFEFVANYKILQTAFEKVGVDKVCQT